MRSLCWGKEGGGEVGKKGGNEGGGKGGLVRELLIFTPPSQQASIARVVRGLLLDLRRAKIASAAAGGQTDRQADKEKEGGGGRAAGQGGGGGREGGVVRGGGDALRLSPKP